MSGSPVPIRDTSSMVETLEHMLELAKSGEIIAFAAVGIEPNDNTHMWKAGFKFSKLRMMGAIHWILWNYSADDEA